MKKTARKIIIALRMITLFILIIPVGIVALIFSMCYDNKKVAGSAEAALFEEGEVSDMDYEEYLRWRRKHLNSLYGTKCHGWA